PTDVAALLSHLESETVEVFAVIPVNQRGRPLGIVEITRGLVDTTLVHPREVFRVAIAYSASAIFIAHNHPSGDPTPSAEDRAVTRQIVQAGQLLDIPVHDHVIVGDERHFSFLSAGLL